MQLELAYKDGMVYDVQSGKTLAIVYDTMPDDMREALGQLFAAGPVLRGCVKQLLDLSRENIASGKLDPYLMRAADCVLIETEQYEQITR